MMMFKKISEKKLFWLMLVFFTVGVVSQFIRIDDHKENDHWVYYRTSKRIEQKSVVDIYSFKDGAFPFQYAPPTLMTISWMGSFTEKSSRQIWLISQALFIFMGFFFLKKIMELFFRDYSVHALCLSFVMFFRYFLDSLYCGQVSGLLFFLFTVGIYYALVDQKKLSTTFFYIIALFKIIPGILIIFNLICSKNKRELLVQLKFLVLLTLLILGIFSFWFLIYFDNHKQFYLMLRSWFEICLSGQQYFDGSTIKSQSLRAFLLRLFGGGEVTEGLWKISISFILIYLFYLWSKIKSLDLKSKCLGLYLGIIVFVVIMPESLPYQIFNLMIPTTFLCLLYLNNKLKYDGKLLMYLLICFCSLATTDLVGHYIADAVQYYSLPLLVFFLFFYVMRSDYTSLIEKQLNVISNVSHL